MISFSTVAPSLADLLRLEAVFEESLQEDKETLEDLRKRGHWACIYVNGNFAGCTVGDPMSEEYLDFPNAHMHADRDDVLYVYSTAFFPVYQGHGYGKLLAAYFMGAAKQQGFNLLIGHATSDSMRAVRKWSGALFGEEHLDWFGSGRTATAYVQPL
jgi:GNAT superfamily N-acetyltransferase